MTTPIFRFRKLLPLTWLLTFFISGSVCAAGLTMNNYGEVLVENLQIGGTYSMIDLVNLPLKIINKDDMANTIKFEIIKPEKGDLKPGFEAVPDTAWIEITPAKVEIAANATYSTDVKIKLPKDAKFVGKKFQADIKATAVPGSQSMVAVALAVKGRLLFTIAQNSTSPQKINMDFSFSPARLIMVDVPVGKKVELQAEKIKLTLNNASKDKTTFILQSLDPKDTTLPKDPDYEICPSANFITFEKEEIVVNGEQTVQVKAFLEIPDKPEFKGKNYQFLLSAKTGGTNSGARYVQVLVKIKK